MNVGVVRCGDGRAGEPFSADRGVTVIDGLCERPDSLAQVGSSFDRLVLLLHHGVYELPALQTALRSAGLDPVGVVVLEDVRGDERLPVTIAGASARAATFGGSRIEQTKPVLPQVFSRRALFRLPAPAYLAVPMVDPGICAAGDGCRACVDACPRDAYRWIDGRIAYDKEVCEPCGICVTSCPVGAVENPATTPGAIRAQIEAIAAASPDPVGVVYHCSRGRVGALGSGWYDIEVPCTGMIDVPWLLAPLLLGAARVAAAPCGDTGCGLAHDARLADRLGFAREVLIAFGLGSERLGDPMVEVDDSPLPSLPLTDPFSSGAAAEVLEGLRALASSTPGRIEGVGSPMGLVELDTGVCTMCTRCSRTCPTGALVSEYDDDALTLSFDTRLCTSCGQCLAVCPEAAAGAISVRSAVDFGALDAGRRHINAAATLSCRSCGNPIAPEAMMDRIAAVLGADPALMTRLTSYCLDCRGRV